MTNESEIINITCYDADGNPHNTTLEIKGGFKGIERIELDTRNGRVVFINVVRKDNKE